MRGTEQLKLLVKSKFPVCRSIIKQVRTLPGRLKPLKSTFTEYYYNNGFGGNESISGRGSDLIQTSAIREQLPLLLKEVNAKSMMDAPCGDFYWMKEVGLNINEYIGVDIVKELIEQNQGRYGNDTRRFVVLDVTKDKLPPVDVVLCRDCLVHFSFKHIWAAVTNLKRSGSKYLLTTTFTNRSANRDITTGNWRPINLELPPFNFPKPIKVINENCTQKNGEYADKSLGLWMLKDIEQNHKHVPHA